MNRSAVAALSGAAGAFLLVGVFFSGYELAHHNVTSADATRTTPPAAYSATPSRSASPATTTFARLTPTPSPVPVVATTRAAPHLVMYTCTGAAVSAPTTFVVACADYGIELEGLSWSGWGQPVAHASGSLLENACVPDCADGQDVPYPASIEVSNTSGGRYTWMHVSAPQAPGGPYDYQLSTNGPS